MNPNAYFKPAYVNQTYCFSLKNAYLCGEISATATIWLTGMRLMTIWTTGMHLMTIWLTGMHLMMDPMVVPNLVSFQFSRMSIPPKIFPTVNLLGPVSTGGGTNKSSFPSRFVKGQDLPMAWRSSCKKNRLRPITHYDFLNEFYDFEVIFYLLTLIVEFLYNQGKQ